jgi:hypothetical protein
MAEKLTINMKGQVAFSDEQLRRLGVRPGEELIVETLSGGRVQISSASRRRTFSDIVGFLHRGDSPVLTIDEINEAIEARWAGER